MQIIRRSDFKTTPWKNGGGITHEAIRVPAGGDSFRWRLSVAQIDRSGPFSDFAGYGRTMVLLKGNGAALKFARGATQLLREVGDMAQFDGALAIQCELENGPCVDLNLMAAKALPDVCARVLRVQGPHALAEAGGSTVIFPIDASVVLRAAGPCATLERWDVALLSHPADGPGSLAPCDGGAPLLVFLATVPDG